MSEPPSPGEIVHFTLSDDDVCETSRLFVSGALIAREGNHFRILLGEETAEELERLAAREATLSPAEPASSD